MSNLDTPPENRTAGALVAAIIHDDDQEALQILCGKLHTYASRRRLSFEEVEESIQELMLSVAQYPDNFLDAENPTNYVYQAFYHSFMRVLKSRKQDDASWSVGSAEGLEDFRSVDPLEALIIADNREQLLRALHDLPRHHATIINMRIFEGASHADIASKVGMDEQVVRGTYSKLSRKMLEELGIIDEQ